MEPLKLASNQQRPLYLQPHESAHHYVETSRATSSPPQWMALVAPVWSFKPLKQEASTRLGASDKGQGWHQETFQGSHWLSTFWHCLHTLTFSSWSWSWSPISLLSPWPPLPPSSLHSCLLPLLLSPLPSWVKQKGMFPWLFLPAAPWRCCCHFFLNGGRCWEEKNF